MNSFSNSFYIMPYNFSMWISENHNCRHFRILIWILENHNCISEFSINFQKTPIVFQNSHLNIRKSQLHFRILNSISEKLCFRKSHLFSCLYIYESMFIIWNSLDIFWNSIDCDFLKLTWKQSSNWNYYYIINFISYLLIGIWDKPYI